MNEFFPLPQHYYPVSLITTQSLYYTSHCDCHPVSDALKVFSGHHCLKIISETILLVQTNYVNTIAFSLVLQTTHVGIIHLYLHKAII
jgi:hypothetical protein